MTLDQGQEAIDIPGGKLVPADFVSGRRVASQLERLSSSAR